MDLTLKDLTGEYNPDEWKFTTTRDRWEKIQRIDDRRDEMVKFFGWTRIGMGYNKFKQIAIDQRKQRDFSALDDKLLKKLDGRLMANRLTSGCTILPKECYCLLCVLHPDLCQVHRYEHSIVKSDFTEHCIVGYVNKDWVITDEIHDPNEVFRKAGIKYDMDKHCQSIEFLVKR